MPPDTRASRRRAEAKTVKKANDFKNCKSCHTRWSRYHRTGTEASDEVGARPVR